MIPNSDLLFLVPVSIGELRVDTKISLDRESSGNDLRIEPHCSNGTFGRIARQEIMKTLSSRCLHTRKHFSSVCLPLAFSSSVFGFPFPLPFFPWGLLPDSPLGYTLLAVFFTIFVVTSHSHDFTPEPVPLECFKVSVSFFDSCLGTWGQKNARLAPMAVADFLLHPPREKPSAKQPAKH